MENELTITETRLIQKFLSKLSDVAIAELIDKPVEVVSLKIAEITGINKKVPYALRLQQEEEAKAQLRTANQKARDKKKNETIQRKKLDAQFDDQMQKRKQQKKALEQEASRKRRAQRKPLFETKQVDYSQLIAVRVDNKTIIYAKPGQDINELKKSFRKAVNTTTDNYRFKTGTNP